MRAFLFFGMNIAESIHVGLCATGFSGRVFHIPFIKAHPGFSITGLVSRGGQNPVPHLLDAPVFTSLAALLEARRPHLVVVNGPTYLHYEQACLALESGAAVVVEKPFTVTRAEAADLIQRSTKSELPIFVYHNKRLESDFLTLKKIIDHDLIGPLREVEWRYDRYRSHLTAKKWKEEDFPGAGTWYDLGCHLVDASIQLFGMPESVYAYFARHREGASVPDYFDVHFYYGDDRVVKLHMGTFTADAPPQLMAFGEKGSYLQLEPDRQEPQLLHGAVPGDAHFGAMPEGSGRLTIIENNQKKTLSVRAEEGLYRLFYEGVYRTLRENKPFFISMESAAEVITCLEAAMLSAREGRRISL